MSGDELDSPTGVRPDRASLEFQRKFGLPEDELLVEEFSCALQHGILHQGKLSVSQHFVCFYSNILISSVQLVLRADSILKVELARVGLIFPTAIRIFMNDAAGTEHLLASFLHRDDAYKLLERVRLGERVGKQAVKSSKQLDAEARALKRTARSSSVAVDQPKHQQLLDKQRRRQQAQEAEEAAASSAPSSRKHSSAGNAAAAAVAEAAASSARVAKPRTPQPPVASDEEDDDAALSMFKKPSASSRKSQPHSKRAVAAAEEDEAHEAQEVEQEEEAEPVPPPRRGARDATTASKRPRRVEPEPEEGEDEAHVTQAHSARHSSSSAAAAAAPAASSGQLLVVPGAKTTAAAPHSAPHASGRRNGTGNRSAAAAAVDPGGGGKRKVRGASAASSGSDGASSDEEGDEFGSSASIWDAVPTYKTADARVTRINARFRGSGLSSALDTRNRRLLHEGFVRRQGKLSVVDRWLFLFTDCLLLAKIVEPETGQTEHRYEAKQRLDLANMLVDARPLEMHKPDSNREQSAAWGSYDAVRGTKLLNVFRVIAVTPEAGSFVFGVSTLQEQRVWLSKLQFAIARHMIATSHPATTAPHNDGWWLRVVRGTLHAAAFDGDLPLLRLLLKNDASPSHVNARLECVHGRTALHIAAAAGQLELAAELLSRHRADQSVQDREGQVPLHIAAKNGDAAMVKILLEHASPKADYTLWHPQLLSARGVNSPSSRPPRLLREQSALWLCVMSRQREWQAVLSLLVEHAGAKAREVLDDRDSQGHTLLEELVRGSLVAVVPVLLAAGASLELPNDNDGLTPLGLAIQYAAKGELAVVRALVEAGAQLNLRRRPWLSAPIHEASSLEQAVFLVEHGGRPRLSGGSAANPHRKLSALFDLSDSAESALLEEAIEGWSLKPILLTSRALKLPPAGPLHSQAKECAICLDEFVVSRDVFTPHKQRKEYCRGCGLSVCGACSSHKLAFPLHKSGQRTTKLPATLPQTSAAGGASTFVAPPPLDPDRDVAPVCDGCYNAAYARGVRLRKERRKRRKARAAAKHARAEADDADDLPPVSDEHDSEREDGAEGATYDGVEAAYHSSASQAALLRDAQKNSALAQGLGTAVAAVAGAADDMLAMVGIKSASSRANAHASEDGGSGAGVSREGSASSKLASKASRAFDKLGSLFTAVHVSQPPRAAANVISSTHGTVTMREDPRFKHTRNASHATLSPTAVADGGPGTGGAGQLRPPTSHNGATSAGNSGSRSASPQLGPMGTSSSSSSARRSGTNRERVEWERATGAAAAAAAPERTCAPSSRPHSDDDEADEQPRAPARGSKATAAASASASKRTSATRSKKERRHESDED